jgi:hypothetical protein
MAAQQCRRGNTEHQTSSSQPASCSTDGKEWSCSRVWRGTWPTTVLQQMPAIRLHGRKQPLGCQACGSAAAGKRRRLTQGPSALLRHREAAAASQIGNEDWSGSQHCLHGLELALRPQQARQGRGIEVVYGSQDWTRRQGTSPLSKEIQAKQKSSCGAAACSDAARLARRSTLVGGSPVACNFSSTLVPTRQRSGIYPPQSVQQELVDPP